MNTDSKLEGTQFTLTAFALGAALGIVGAILLAPKSGKETREYIVDSSLNLKEHLIEAKVNMMDKALYLKQSAIQKFQSVDSNNEFLDCAQEGML